MTHRSAYDDAERRYADRVARAEEYGPTPCPSCGDGEPEIPEHILAHDDRCGAVTGGICDCREWERFDEDRRDPDDDRDECDCLAAEEDGHKADEHKSCGMSMRSGEACGGCHSCIEAQISYYQRQQPYPHPACPLHGDGEDRIEQLAAAAGIGPNYSTFGGTREQHRQDRPSARQGRQRDRRHSRPTHHGREGRAHPAPGHRPARRGQGTPGSTGPATVAAVRAGIGLGNGDDHERLQRLANERREIGAYLARGGDRI